MFSFFSAESLACSASYKIVFILVVNSLTIKVISFLISLLKLMLEIYCTLI